MKPVKQILLAHDIQKILHDHADPERARISSRFFKTGQGDYAQGDIFIGIRVPEIRKFAHIYCQLAYSEIKILIMSPIHEERLLAILILVHNFKKAHKKNDLQEQAIIFDFYCEHISYVNNWDLVDQAAPHILGPFCFQYDRLHQEENTLNAPDVINPVLKKWVSSENLWIRRMAIVSTLYYIRQNNCDTTIIIARELLYDKHDLIHKATGWMLREAAQRNRTHVENFLDSYANIMPRTMLRYTLEKFDTHTRIRYMSLK